MDSSGIINHLSAIPNGTGFNERVGLKVKGKSIQIRLELIRADSTQLMRVIVFRWFCQSTPTVGDILEGTPWPLNATSVNRAGEYQIMYDNMFALSASTNANFVDKFFIERPMNITFTTADAVDLGHVYLLAISDSIAVTHPTISYWSRLRYTDS